MLKRLIPVLIGLFHLFSPELFDCLTWTQTSSPLIPGTVTGFQLHSGLALLSSASGLPFIGLHSGMPQALLTGNEPGLWWFAVGANSLHNGQVPGPSNMLVSKLELFTVLKINI